MRIGVVHVDSVGVRLLVAVRENGSLKHVCEEHGSVMLRGEAARSDAIPEPAMREAARRARHYVRLAHLLGCGSIEVAVASPARRSADGALARLLGEATGLPVRLLRPEDEGLLAYAGAGLALRRAPRSLVVCHVGGDSTQIVLGTPESGPMWWRNVELGTLTPTARSLAQDPPRRRDLAAAQLSVRRTLAGFAPPLPEVALAAGSTARALGRLAGEELGREELAWALRRLHERRAGALVRRLGLEREQLPALTSGALILAELQRRLGLPLRVAQSGVSEGAALELLAELEAA